MPQRYAPVVAAMCASAVFGAGADAPPAASASVTFRVLLDGKPIGQHRFSATASADDATERTIVSEASFAVRFLGITVYRYQHRAVEHWRGDCLIALLADTDDNGMRTHVSARAQGERFEVSAPAPQAERGCVMSFAYWNPALRAQQRLLNAQTGHIEPVLISALGDHTLTGGESAIPAFGWRISGQAQSIDVWYSPQGDWLGLDTRVEGGRSLSYRRL